MHLDRIELRGFVQRRLHEGAPPRAETVHVPVCKQVCVRARAYAQTHACKQANSWVCTHQPNIAALTPRKEHTNRATAQPGKRDDAGVLLLRESAAGGWTLTPVWELTCTQPQQQSIHCSWCPIEKAGPSLLTPL